MEQRPRLKLTLSLSDKLLELLGWGAVISIWVIVLIYYPDLPDNIPTHYNGRGVVDAVGDKASIFTLPTVATLLFIGLTILHKFPHRYNYLVTITPDNARQQYTLATRMLRYLKLVIVIIFGLIERQTIRNALAETNGLGRWFLPFTLGLIFIPILYYAVKSSKVV